MNFLLCVFVFFFNSSMSKPRSPDPARIFLSAIYREAATLDACLTRLTAAYGPIDHATRATPFTGTGFYYPEMGSPLLRRLFTFRDLVDPGILPALKLFTNALEAETALAGARAINLDPGILNLQHLVLASGKPAAHRPYLADGIYADLTLVYETRTLKPLRWTYPDYAEPEMIAFLLRLRAALKNDLKEWRTGKQECGIENGECGEEQGPGGKTAMNDKIEISDSDALIVVDVQNDFCPGGSMPVADGDQVVPVLNGLMARFSTVVLTRDWHPRDHVSFSAEPQFMDRSWPPHCVAGTSGADFHPPLEVPAGAIVVSKGADRDREAYSGFQGTNLAEDLHRRGIRRVLVGGLATDYCVKATVLDALKSGFTAVLIADAARGVDIPAGTAEQAVKDMAAAGASVVESADII
jgi:nicotinamidase/pyrazinamidase